MQPVLSLGKLYYLSADLDKCALQLSLRYFVLFTVHKLLRCSHKHHSDFDAAVPQSPVPRVYIDELMICHYYITLYIHMHIQHIFMFYVTHRPFGPGILVYACHKNKIFLHSFISGAHERREATNNV